MPALQRSIQVARSPSETPGGSSARPVGAAVHRVPAVRERVAVPRPARPAERRRAEQSRGGRDSVSWACSDEYVVSVGSGCDRLACERKPLAILGPLAARDLEERPLDVLGDRTRLAAADGLAVDLANRRHFDGRAREKQLVRT